MNRRHMNLWVIFAAWFSAGACVFAGESINVKQYDITWTFDQAGADRPVYQRRLVGGAGTRPGFGHRGQCRSRSD